MAQKNFSCAMGFAQFLACLHMAPISSKTTVAESVSTPISSKSTFAHAVLHKLNRKRHFEVVRTFLTFLQYRATGQWRTVFGTGFSLLTIRDSCAPSFPQGLAFSFEVQTLDKATVAQCGLPCVIWSNKPVVHSVLHSSYLKNYIEVCWILFTPHTNLSILTVVRFFLRKLQVKR